MAAGGRRGSAQQRRGAHSDYQHSAADDTDAGGGGGGGDGGGTGRIGPRSQSLTALQQAPPARMAQLENLEAKMASIEVSLSAGAPRRRRVTASKVPQRQSPHKSSPQQPKMQQQTQTAAEVLELAQCEQRLRRLRAEAEQKRLAIKNLRLALDRLDITDNIDVRIRQAELEYQLGREELDLLTVAEEARTLQARLDEPQRKPCASPERAGSLYETLLGEPGGRAELVAVRVPLDHQGGARFGLAPVAGLLCIEWAAEGTGLRSEDRLIEINGRVVCGRKVSPADAVRLMAARPDRAELVVARHAPLAGVPDNVSTLRHELDMVRERAEEARRAKDGLTADNIRLTHRISYLEEQVKELMQRTSVGNVTSIDVSSGQQQVFQKGPSISVLPSSGGGGGGGGIDGRSVRSLDLDAGARQLSDVDYASEPAVTPRRHRPPPPKKPLRLSLHRRAQSLQSVQPSPSPSPATPPLHAQQQQQPPPSDPGRKRTHRGERTIGALRWSTSGGPPHHHHHNHHQTQTWC